MRKLVALLLTVSLVWWTMVPAASAQSTAAVGPPGLIQVEQILYGRAQEGAVAFSTGADRARLVRPSPRRQRLFGASAKASKFAGGC